MGFAGFVIWCALLFIALAFGNAFFEHLYRDHPRIDP